MKLLTWSSILLMFLNPLNNTNANDVLSDKLLNGGKESVCALKEIIGSAEHRDAMTLFLAAGVALNQGDRVNSAYLFYVAKFRVQFDKELFPPTATGGNSPMVAFGAVSSQIGAVINPQIMRYPEEFHQSVLLTNAWSPKLPKDYDPGWEYSDGVSPASALESHQARKKEFGKGMGNMAKLLKMPEYHSSFLIVQEYNMNWGENRPTDEAYESAKVKLQDIEKTHKIEGMFYKPE